MDEVQQQVLERQKMVWSLGDYASRIVGFLKPVATHLVRECNVSSGMRFLDVGAGTGNLATEAARAGASVVAVDPTTHLLEIGRAQTGSEGLDIEWREADAQNLPFEEASFDVVGSVMGAMFAPDADATVREMLRVTKPGGLVAMSSWAKEGYTGETLAVSSRYMPPPPEGVNTSGEWGDEATARSRFERYTDDVAIHRGATSWSFESHEESRKFWEEEAPPGVAAKMALPPDRFEELATELEAVEERFNTGSDGKVTIESGYLLIVARKPGG